ncbi:XRE family transcriptional regulator [Spongiactinospora gelatinilytica]|uniref:XRE family transcriptional regulator n=1 Tax=Spongiactinospora gelatinilytica TaxID=2666298 RepID=A0A2W2GVL2_9ACTN|nr:helix-turn-helix transcriptional regulator [Spongiactinospora gelatinilytica]PZG51982.1 XRE family transcriptional regulator [Spongiactinospora gelatinilytica]
MAAANPTLRRRQLAARLRELRKESGLSIDEVAQKLLCSPAKISRIETAQRAASLRDVRDLAAIYAAGDPSETRTLMTMAQEAKQPGWWQQYDDPDVRGFIGLEEAATSITVYETCLVPGLFQTEDYARAVIKGVLPRIRPDVLQERVETRLKRQELLFRESPPRYWTVLDESVLHRHIGGPGVMRAQLARVVELAELPHVVVQVVPFSVGAHMGLDNAFTFLQLSDPAVPDTVFVEGLMGLIYLEKPTEIEIYREALESLRAAGLDPARSMARIAEISRSYAE